MKSKEAKYSEGVIYAWTELLIKKIKNFIHPGVNYLPKGEPFIQLCGTGIDACHGLLPILYDTMTLFVQKYQLYIQCVFIY